MYLQDCFAQYCATKNLAAFDLFEKNLYWILAGFNVEFTDILPFWSEKIETEIWISEVTKSKIFTDFVLKHNNKIFAKGDSCWFILDTQTKRPSKADFVKESFEICNEIVFGEHKKFSLNEIKEKIVEIKYKINQSDLDFNGHVNNKSYVNIADLTTPEEFKKTKQLKMLSVKFNKESFLGDELICSAYRTDIPNSYIHKIENNGISICDIATSWTEKLQTEIINDYKLKIKEPK
jgi:acyl-ACP thioesterase